MINYNAKKNSVWAFIYFMILVLCVGVFGKGINFICVFNFFILVLLCLNKRRLRIRRANIMCMMTIVCSYIVVITIINIVLRHTIYEVNSTGAIKRLVVVYVSMLWFVIYISGRIDRKFFFRMYIDFVLIGCAFGFIEKLIGRHIFKGIYNEAWDYSNNIVRVNSFFVHPNLYGMILIIALINLLFYPMEKKKQFGAMLLIVCNIYFTRSKGIWLALLLLFILLICSRINELIRKNGVEIKYSRKKTVELLAVIFFLSMAVFVNRNVIGKYVLDILIHLNTGIFGEEASKLNRVVLFKAALKFLFSKEGSRYLLIGGGDGFAIEFLKHNSVNGWIGAVDNQYLTILMNYGIVAVFLFVIWIVQSIVDFFNPQNNQEYKMYSLMLIIMATCMIFYEGFAVISFIGFLIFFISYAKVNSKGV